MKLFLGLGSIAIGVLLVARAGAAALPYPDGFLLPNQQHRPVDVTVDGNHAALILPGGIPQTFQKSGGGIWSQSSGFPTGALSISIRDGAPPMAATGYADRIEIRAYDSGEDAWDLADTITLAAGDRATRVVLQDGLLAAIVEEGSLDGETVARIYRDNAGDWIHVKRIPMDPPPPLPGEILITGSRVNSLDLNGTRLAIGSVGLNQVWIHERDSGGANNWGRVTVVPAPAGQRKFGSALALEGERLAAVSSDNATNKPVVRAFERNTGGTDVWGEKGIVLTGPNASSSLVLDMADSRLAVLGLPGDSALFTGTGGGHGWFFGSSASPSGWVEEAQQDFGQIFVPGGARQLIALDGTDCFVGLPDEEYLDSHGAAWAACVHRRGTGEWNRVQLLEGPGLPAELGKVLAMRGPYLIAGMPGDDGFGTNSGAVMIWTVISLPIDGDRWFPVGRFHSPSPVAGQRFGAAVAIGAGGEDQDDYWVAVGAPGTNSNRGAVYLFNLSSIPAGGPVMLTRTPAAGLAAGDEFGASVALSGVVDVPGPLILAAGAAGKDVADTDSGAVYLFKQDLPAADGWGEWRTISRPLIPGGKFFGDKVAIAGDGGLAVGQQPVGGVPGKVYLFSRDQGGSSNWGLSDRIDAPVAAPPRFAETLSASRAGIVIGAPGGSSGRAYYYSAGTTPATIFGDVTSSPEFGSAVSISDEFSLMVGDPGADSGAGRISVWTRENILTPTWDLLYKRDGSFASAFGSAVASGRIYYAGGTPASNAAGSGYGAIEIDRAGSYERWAASQGPGFNDWFPDHDADQDGQANLVEFALGSNPRNGVPGLFTMNLTVYPLGPEPYPAMRFVRPNLPYSKSALHYRMDRSIDLQVWLTARYDVSLDDPLARYFTATEPRGYFRLRPKYPDFKTEVEGGLVPVE
jgi:hypothetical protein